MVEVGLLCLLFVLAAGLWICAGYAGMLVILWACPARCTRASPGTKLRWAVQGPVTLVEGLLVAAVVYLGRRHKI